MREQNYTFINYHSKGNPICSSIHIIIALIGVTFNLISIILFGRKELKKHSYSNYWKTIALFDSFILLYVIQHWTKCFLKIDNIDTISPFFCRFSEYFAYVAGGISLWLETMITLDRYFTIIHPNRFKFVKQKPFQITVFLLIVVYNLIIFIRLPIKNQLIDINNNENTPIRICRVDIEVMKINWIVSLDNILIVNLLINPILDFKIISHIISTRPSNVNRCVGSNRSNDFRDRKFALSAIAINLNGLILKLPFLTGSLLSIFLDFRFQDEFEAFYSISLCLSILDRSDIFFVNFIVNSIFRREFFSMFRLI